MPWNCPSISLPCCAFFAVPVELLQTSVEGRVIVAAVGLGPHVERHDGGQRIRHLGFRHEIAPAEFHAIDAEVFRRQFEQPLAEEVRLEPPRPAIGADRGLVGDEDRHLHIDIRHPIGAGQDLRHVAGAGGAVGAQIGADVGIGVPAQRQDGAVAVAGDFEIAFDVARVVGCEQMLAAVLDPFHRPADKARRERNQEILRIEFAAHAEAAADVVLDHADGLLGQAQMLRQDTAVGERDLGGAEHGELLRRRVPVGHKAARLHHHRGEALDLEVLAPRIGRGLERSVRVAFDCRERAGEVGAGLLEGEHRAAARRVAIGDDRQALDIDLDRLERVLGQRLRIRDHHRDRLAHIADLAFRDHRLLEARELGHRLLPQAGFSAPDRRYRPL